MAKRVDLTGLVFNHLTVLSRSEVRKGTRLPWICLCKCGNIVDVIGNDIVTGHTKSCGCIKSEAISKSRTTHGRTRTTEYVAWLSMKARCYNQNNQDYQNYGGRGIKVCERWLNSFENFLKDMGNAPLNQTLDRVEVNGDYAPTNCRWTHACVQSFNRRKMSTNTSGRTGVSWDRKRLMWVVRISYKTESLYLGSYLDFNEAVSIREAAELKYYGVIKE